RWLPHIWSDDRKQRYLATSRVGTSQLLGALEGLLRRRAASRDDQREPASPTYVVLVTDTSLVENLPLLPLLLSPDPIPNVTVVFVADNLPNRCQIVLDVRQAPAQLLAKTAASAPTSFRTDQADGTLVDAFAKSLAPLRV